MIRNRLWFLQSWLQQFVWSKKQVQPRMRAILKQSPTMARAIESHPIFCMETALKMLVWSTVVYEDATSQEGMPPLKGASQAQINADIQEDNEDDNENKVQ